MKYRGFTLLELVITLTIGGFLFFSALVSWSQLKQRNEKQFLVNQIKMTIHYAKMQALNYDQPLELSVQTSGGNWSTGMNLTRIVEGSKQLIHKWYWKSTYWMVEWSGVDGLNTIVITGNANTAMSNGKFIITNKQTQEKVVLILNRLGRVREV